MSALDFAKLTIGIVTAVAVVLVGAWTQLTLRRGIEELQATVRQEKQATEQHGDKIDDLEKGVAEAKRDAKAKPSKFVVVVPTVVAVIQTPTPEMTPRPKGLLNLLR